MQLVKDSFVTKLISWISFHVCLVLKVKVNTESQVVMFILNLRFLMFLKLFLGMGLIWSFEIIGGICGDNIAHESAW